LAVALGGGALLCGILCPILSLHNVLNKLAVSVLEWLQKGLSVSIFLPISQVDITPSLSLTGLGVGLFFILIFKMEANRILRKSKSSE
jgi:hypothetical protein